MYKIFEEDDFLCECSIQDGTERWREATRENAVRSMISAARVLNGTYIREDDIEFIKVENKKGLSKDEILLDQIKRGEKVVFNFDDKRVKYRLTDEECDLIIKIREHGSCRDIEKMLH